MFSKPSYQARSRFSTSTQACTAISTRCSGVTSCPRAPTIPFASRNSTVSARSRASSSSEYASSNGSASSTSCHIAAGIAAVARTRRRRQLRRASNIRACQRYGNARAGRWKAAGLGAERGRVLDVHQERATPHGGLPAPARRVISANGRQHCCQCSSYVEYDLRLASRWRPFAESRERSHSVDRPLPLLLVGGGLVGLEDERHWRREQPNGLGLRQAVDALQLARDRRRLASRLLERAARLAPLAVDAREDSGGPAAF